jgi:hypothetical protein
MSPEPRITEPESPKSESVARGERSRKRRDQLLSALPWLWLALSAVWAAVIFVTDQLAWPLALWIATTLGPLTMLRARLGSDELAEGTSR